MNNYVYNNKLIGKKQLKQLLAWCFTNYKCVKAYAVADKLKNLGFKYATKAGLSISIEDLKVPFMKNHMLQKANKEILNTEKICLKGKITDVERFQKIIDTWSLTSEALKNEVISYFKNYDPLNSVYIMAFSGARGNVSQVRQLVGMRGLMSDPSGAILKLPIKKNFREGLTITDYLMSAYGARKGIVDTALKTANSGYLTRRLIDVAQDILIREKDCFSKYSYLIVKQNFELNTKKMFGRLINKPVYNPITQELIANVNEEITPNLLNVIKQNNIKELYVRSPLTCKLYRSVCQSCYGWDIAKEALIDFGEAVGIIAGQSIGEPGTQLTMRTFHTGGIFTAEVSQQIKSPIDGLIKFSKLLKTIILRTNKGESVLFTKSSGSVTIIPENNRTKLLQFELIRNTILFVKNNQYIKKNIIIGELTANQKQIRTEIVPILSLNAGEVIIPHVKSQSNLKIKNQLLWVLAGQFYKGPINSFLNFYSDYKINKFGFIFRTKIVTPFSGFVEILNNQNNLFQQSLKITNKIQAILNCHIKKWYNPIIFKYYILTFKNYNYIINGKFQKYFGRLFTNKFRTLTGGTIYYLNPINSSANKKIYYYKNNKIDTLRYILQEIIFLADILLLFNNVKKNKLNNKNLGKNWKNQIFDIWNEINCRNNSITSNFIKISNTSIWLNEETFNLNCTKNMLLVEDGNFISRNFEIFPSLFSKTEGIVTFYLNNNIVQNLSIKSGTIYAGKNLSNFSKNVYFPGERITSNIPIKYPSFCDSTSTEKDNRLLIRPLEIYEIPFIKSVKKIIRNIPKLKNLFSLESNNLYFYKSNQNIKRNSSINLISNALQFKSFEILTNNLIIEIIPNLKNQFLNILVTRRIFFNNYIPPNLKYNDIQYSLAVEKSQFLNKYITIGYIESISQKSLKIIKVKSKFSDSRQIFLISNENCIRIKKNSIKNENLDELIINKENINYSGRIIFKNKKILTVQKGRPYFFPNCKSENFSISNSIEYKIFLQSKIPQKNILNTNRLLNIRYFDLTKKRLTEKSSFEIKVEYSKMFMKKNESVFIKTLPILVKKASVQNQYLDTNSLSQLKVTNNIKKQKKKDERKQKKFHIFLKDSEILFNNIRNNKSFPPNLIMFKLIGTPFQNSINIYPITEDYFEDEYNTVFCKNNQFVENGQTLGLLNFEKEITGDIVQGLPRIEQLFEARKIRLIHKLIPTNKKKHLLIQKTSIDSSFEFRKLGTSIKEDEKINPHNLLKMYFNYYGSRKKFLCDRTQTFVCLRLMNNYEASYRTFKKVQSLILNLIQSVYKSQGVTILNKHFEIIIKQMTTKVLITHEGTTALLPREIIDLYHIQYINKISRFHKKQPAYYVPLLFGITKAALNNPSFISAASFQETTRVLTKAAIEGKLDWLRGLKENIIIGRLIPAGTGAHTYRNCFRKKVISANKLQTQLKNSV